MKKVFFLTALLGSVVALAEDSYLYWMVDSATASSMANADYAKIRDANGSGYLNIYNEGFGSLAQAQAVSGSEIKDAADWGEGFYAGIPTGTTLPTDFIVELYNEGGTFLGQSVMSGIAASALYNGGMAVPVATASSFSSFAIPEPSSGLLMLVGCAMLGLRRRKLKVA